MRETIKCCMSCILPCGALDVIRIVHANGKVEEISHAVRAGEIMQAYPKHVLRKPPAVIVPPTAELRKGKIYFLMPVSSAGREGAAGVGKEEEEEEDMQSHGSATDIASLLLSDRYLSDILSEKASSQRDRRRGRVGVWRPHLESISEVTNDF
ncbi:unnamed protein product [Spirodela intermedia]|uniref:Uncharacterized protein n=1 Tax=Spirodela intermedia TaxID=51605 RepID=A0A7I8J863_SPIIN|nr:unnamed protein product [Spirodela intermedia]CAA6665623.1 unnamed protein product [Spirodela intermedia]